MVAGCTKDHVKLPDEEEPARTAEQLRKGVLGKWLFNGTSFEAIASVKTQARQGNRLVLGPLKSAMARNSIMAETGGAADQSGFIEFLDDGTYFLHGGGDRFFIGTFAVKNGQTIDLSDFGSIAEIEFTSGKMDFQLLYTSTNTKFTLLASKVAEIGSDDRTKLLTGTVWQISQEEDGKALYDEGIELYDENDQFVRVQPIDKAIVHFTISGTCAVQFSYQSARVQADIQNWKWHTSEANKLMYYNNGEAVDESRDAGFLIFTELTNSMLRMTNYQESEDNNGNIGEGKFVLKSLQ